MSDDLKMDFSEQINEARKKRVESFKLDVDLNDSEDNDIVEETDDTQKDLPESEEKEDSGIDSSAPSKMMADDFSEKYSLHKYTDANQIKENEEFVYIDDDEEENEAED